MDLYYTFSIDGGVSWNDLERISSSTSTNLTDGQEFGDYNGISVVGEKVIPVWTDNRDGPPDRKDVYAADVDNVTASSGFVLSGDPLDQAVWAPGNLDDVAITVGSVAGFSNPVLLSYSSLPAGSVGGFSSNPASTPGSSTAQVSIGTLAAGDYSFDILGTATDASDKSLTVNLTASDALPVVTTLLTPADTATVLSTSPTMSWSPVSGASNYLVEVDDDPNFGSIDFSTTTEATSVVPDIALNAETTNYWRVRAVNPCGNGQYSVAFSFTTGLAICSTSIVPIPDPGATADIMSVASSGVITDLDIELRATHTYVGDLTFTLVHVDTGTSVTFVDRPGVPASTFGCGSDNIDTTLDDGAAGPVESQCSTDPAIGGTFTPNNPLSAFNGENLAGTWRLNATDAVGSDFGSLDEWCLLPQVEEAIARPTMTTGAATMIEPTSARLNGAVNPNGAATIVRFIYGMDTSYGETASYGGAGAGSSPVSVGVDVAGLVCNTTYHYRIVGKNSEGGAAGADRTFITPVCPGCD